MLKLRAPSFVLPLALAGLLAACDSGAPDAAQESAQDDMQQGGEEEAFTGAVDRSLAGTQMPVVTVIDPQGVGLNLRETKGEPVLLNLWATWCAPCVVEMPLLDDLAGELDGQLRILTVSEDMKGAEVVMPFFEDRKFAHLPRWMDPTNDLAFAFGGGAVLPLTVLYDAEGKEVWRIAGAYDWGSEEARELVLEASQKAGA